MEVLGNSKCFVNVSKTDGTYNCVIFRRKFLDIMKCIYKSSFGGEQR